MLSVFLFFQRYFLKIRVSAIDPVSILMFWVLYICSYSFQFSFISFHSAVVKVLWNPNNEVDVYRKSKVIKINLTSDIGRPLIALTMINDVSILLMVVSNTIKYFHFIIICKTTTYDIFIRHEVDNDCMNMILLICSIHSQNINKTSWSWLAFFVTTWYKYNIFNVNVCWFKSQLYPQICEQLLMS